MIRKIQDFIDDWKNESKSKLKIFNNLTDESLLQKVYSEGRSIGILAWHIVWTLYEMPEKAGLVDKIVVEKNAVPKTVKDLSDSYLSASKNISDEVLKKWTDESLTDEIDMYGEKWKKGSILDSLIRHEIHHRAQITVLMRQAGLKVPGVFGPSKEEWASYGMEPEE
ncbi:MAG: DinB family protein [Ignavibacteriae bacterium]|nr:DinB family protein [Ignavibacteriota bacterium]